MAIPVGKSGGGISGIADIQVLEGKDGNWELSVTLDGKVTRVFGSDVPCKPSAKLKKAFVKLNSEGSVVWQISPEPGNYIVRFLEFGHKKDMPPEPFMADAKVGTARDGRKFEIPAMLKFTATFEVIKGAGKHLTAVMSIPYAFLPYTAPGETQPSLAMIAGRGKGKLEEFLRDAGMDFNADSIPWSENVLPVLEEMLKSKNLELVAEVGNGGWINSLTEVPEVDDED